MAPRYGCVSAILEQWNTQSIQIDDVFGQIAPFGGAR